MRTASIWSTRSLHHLTDLHQAGPVEIVALVRYELGGRRGQRTLHLSHAAEEQVSDSVVWRRRPWRKAADAPIDLRPHQPAGTEESAREFQMGAEIITPVEPGSGSRGVHHTDADHG